MNQLSEDHSVFFSEFATTATKQDGSTIAVIFDYEHNEFLDNAEGRSCTAQLPTEQVSNLYVGESLEIGSRIFEILSIQPQNDEAISKLILKEI